MLLFLFLVPLILKSDTLKSNRKSITAQEIYEGIMFDCSSKNLQCITSDLKELTIKYGPAKALSVLEIMQKEKKIDLILSTHTLVHSIGEQTAKTYGANLNSYKMCPESGYFGACHHGFLEAAVLNDRAFLIVEKEICAKLKNEGLPRFYVFNCYHGIGHGIFMVKGEEIIPALKMCDLVASSEDAQSCWSGVFNAGLMDHPVTELSAKDPFAPCNNLESKYSSHCFKYIVFNVFEKSGSLHEAAEACNRRGVGDLCAGTLGSFITDINWMNKHVGSVKEEELIPNAIRTCNLFPESMREDCTIGGLQRLIFNSKGEDIAKEARGLCGEVQNSIKKNCYFTIGSTLAVQINDKVKLKKLCDHTPKEFTEYCYLGGGI